MPVYVLVPLVACIVSAATALALCARDPHTRRTWPLAGLSGCASIWAFCEVNWNLSTSPETTLVWMRAAALGWIPIGPIALLALAIAADADTPTLRRWVKGLLLFCIPWLGVATLTPLMISRAIPTSWGWSTQYEPVVLLHQVFAAGCVCAGMRIRRLRQGTRDRDGFESFLRWLEFGLPLTVVSLTDVLLPFFGHHEIPRFGTLSLAGLGVTYSLSIMRYGESEMIPEGLNGAVLERLPDGIVYISADGRVRAANRRFGDLVGLEATETVGQPLAAFLSEPVTDPLRELRDETCRLLREGQPDIGVSISTHYRYDNWGRVIGLVVVVRDLRAFTALEDRVLLSGRMAAVGELAAGLAHELNNPLSYVTSNMNQMRTHFDALEKTIGFEHASEEVSAAMADCRDIMNDSLHGLQRTTSIVRDVLEFAQSPSERPLLVDPSDLVEQSLRVGRSLIPDGVEVISRSSQMPQVYCVPLRIKQALLCLLSNASQAVEPGGAITVETSVESHSLVIAVSDDGCGIEKEQLDRIFDPFYSTRPAGVGTGLGLTIAFGIARDHGGSLRVSSEPGHGSRFALHLPLDPPRPTAGVVPRSGTA